MGILRKDNVAIVGAGIIGVCCALELVKKGFDVSLIDPEKPCSVTSFGNAGVISPWSCTPQSMPGNWKKIPKWILDPNGPVFIRRNYMLKFFPWAVKFLKAGRLSKINSIADGMFAMTKNSVENYRNLLHGTGKEYLVKNSFYVHLYRKNDPLLLNQLSWKLRKERDVPVEFIDKVQLKNLEPAISDEFSSAIIIKNQGRTINPELVGKTIFRKAQALGLKHIKKTVKKISVNLNNGYEIRFQNSSKNFDKVVLSAGVWSTRLLEPFGISLPLESERGYHIVCTNPGIEVNNSVMDTDRMFVASLMEKGLRVAGTAEFAGLNAKPDYRRADVFKKLIKGIFPKINTKETKEWMGSRPTFPDSLPCLGEVNNLPGLYAAFGHGHYGLSMAPMTAKIIANCITNQKQDISLSPYSLKRFQ